MKGIQSPRREWLCLLLIAGLVGCAGGRARALPVGLHGYARYHSASPAPLHGDAASEGAGGTVGDEAPARMPPGTVLIGSAEERTRQAVELGLLEVDAFEKLLLRAGLEDPPVGRNPFTPEDAAEVLNRLMERPVTLGTYPPRMAAGFVLREVLEGGAVSRGELARRVERFVREQVAVLRPDGYLAWALDGRTQQKVGTVQWRDGTFRAGNFELGRFYSGKGGVFRHVDAQLRAADWRPLAEVYDDADVIGRSLDGAEDAFVELYHGMGQLLSHAVVQLREPAPSPAGRGSAHRVVARVLGALPVHDGGRADPRSSAADHERHHAVGHGLGNDARGDTSGGGSGGHGARARGVRGGTAQCRARRGARRSHGGGAERRARGRHRPAEGERGGGARRARALGAREGVDVRPGPALPGADLRTLSGRGVLGRRREVRRVPGRSAAGGQGTRLREQVPR
ncbi:hypothetical protein COCOR_00885 [Corallococcus coralloides DSM 2259]|uniref:Lipoprotein n=1 Tax=Corallococcus coralloides (strain ATCC 25202 / DSM 2259 / NBRC 100086 / M2) TaxID=1144275 RepID=H8MK53_CORCM|nr:hypothetical protein COCOR_00885 [Corallococcus coralloides DSM 2259]